MSYGINIWFPLLKEPDQTKLVFAEKNNQSCVLFAFWFALYANF